MEKMPAISADYQIMCPADERISGKMYRWKDKMYYRSLCEEIQKYLAKEGIAIEIVPYAPTTKEDKVIIVGPVDGVCDRWLMKNVHTYEYIVKTSGNRIVLGAWLDHPLRLAVERLLEIFGEHRSEDGEIVIPTLNEVHSLPRTTRDPSLPNAYRDHFVYTYYWGPTASEIDEELIGMIRDIGKNRLFLGGEGREKILKVAELCRKYGMDIMLDVESNPIFSDLVYSATPHTDEEIDNEVEKILAEYGGIPEIVEWHICDEPRNSENVARIMNSFRRHDPTLALCVNQVYGSGEEYYTHMMSYLSKAEHDMLSLDRYELVGYEPRLYCRDYFDTLLTISDFAQRYDLPATMINQFTSYRVFDIYRSVLYAEQIRWEDNIALAYGFKCISHFTMHASWEELPDIFEGGMFDKEWRPTKFYYELKKVAPKITAHGNLLLDKKFEMVYHIGTGETLGAPKYIPFGDLGRIDGKDAIIGFFSDGTFMLTNYVFKTGAPMNTITICEHNGRNLEWYDTSDETWKDARECETVELTFDGYKVSLLPGDAEVFRVVK